MLRHGFKTGLLLGAIAVGIALSGFKHSLSHTSSRPGVYELADPGSYSAVYAISDIHGMLDSLQKILKGANLIDESGHWSGGKALLVIVGDSIDKGPNSVEVVELLRQLADEAPTSGGAVVHLLGNHEAELLADPEGGLSKTLKEELKAKGLKVSEFVSPSSQSGAFLRAEPLAAKIGNWIFGHSGLFPDMSWHDFASKADDVIAAGKYGNSLLQSDSSILEAKGWWKRAEDRKSYLNRLNGIGIVGVVQGHQPDAYGISDKIGAIEGGHLVKIDCGASPPAGSNPLQMLEFPKPAQLAGDQVPKMLVIDEEGQVVPIHD